MFRIAAHTDIGPRKETNQDSCCALVAETANGETALMAVCDGVGGLASGELASASMANWLMSWFETDYPRLLKRWASWGEGPESDNPLLLKWVQEEWSAGLCAMNDSIRAYGASAKTQLGTTCTAILFVGGKYVVAHVGDSRVYRFSNGAMDILTQDHTWVAQQVALGAIPPEQARNHPKRNVILQSVGTQVDLQPEFSEGVYEVGDAFMLCCDGFRNQLFDDELLGAFGNLQEADEAQIADSCRALTELVLGRGETDNITVVAASIQPEKSSSGADSDAGETVRLSMAASEGEAGHDATADLGSRISDGASD